MTKGGHAGSTKGVLQAEFLHRRDWLWDPEIGGKVLVCGAYVMQSHLLAELNIAGAMPFPSPGTAGLQSQRFWVKGAFQDAKK